MNSSQTHLLLDAFFHFVFTTIVNCILFTLVFLSYNRFCILFYAVFKTVTSLEDENEREKWLKYWVFYGLFSVICSYLEKGSFIKACVCGVLLLKFNVSIPLSLHRRTTSFCTLPMMWFCPTSWRILTDTWLSLWTLAPTTFSSLSRSFTGPSSLPSTRATVRGDVGL